MKKRDIFDALVERRWSTSATPPPISQSEHKIEEESWDEYHDQDVPPRCIPKIEDTVDIHGKLLCQKPAYARIINAEVLLQNGDNVQSARVLQKSIGPNGFIAGKYNDNPSLNTIVYELEFPDGSVKEYSSNIIAEIFLIQVYSDGFTITMMEGIVYHKIDTEVSVFKDDMHVVTCCGKNSQEKNVVGSSWYFGRIGLNHGFT